MKKSDFEARFDPQALDMQKVAAKRKLRRPLTVLKNTGRLRRRKSDPFSVALGGIKSMGDWLKRHSK